MRLSDRIKNSCNWVRDCSEQTKFGLVATIVLAVGFGCLAYFYPDEKPKNLNEWANYIAGACSALAFLWLVLGYIQHGEGLRSNTDTLIRQMKVLEAQTKHTECMANNMQIQAMETGKLAEITKQQDDRISSRNAREAAPVFVPIGVLAPDENTNMTIRNAGAAIYEIQIHHKEPHRIYTAAQSIIQSDEEFTVTLTPGGELKYPVSFCIACTDHLSCRHETKFSLETANRLIKLSHKRSE